MLFSCVKIATCLSEGFEALNRVLVTVKGKSKIYILAMMDFATRRGGII
jgi:hypothetical protein